MIKPLWALAGIAFVGTVGAAAIYVSSLRGEEEVFEDEDAASSEEVPEPCTTIIPVEPLATQGVIDPSLPWIPADWATYAGPDGRFSFRYPPALFQHEGRLTTWKPGAWDGAGLPSNSMRITVLTRSACAPTECGGLQLVRDGSLIPRDAAYMPSGGRAWFGSQINDPPVDGVNRRWEYATIVHDLCLHLVFEFAGIEWLESTDTGSIISSVLFTDEVDQAISPGAGEASTSGATRSSSPQSETSGRLAPGGCVSDEMAHEDTLGRFAFCYPSVMKLRTFEPGEGKVIVEVGYTQQDNNSFTVAVGWDGKREQLCREGVTALEAESLKYQSLTIDGREATGCIQDLDGCSAGPDELCTPGVIFARALDTALMLDVAPIFISVTYFGDGASTNGAFPPGVWQRILDSLNIY